jgi:hypothetical protein
MKAQFLAVLLLGVVASGCPTSPSTSARDAALTKYLSAVEKHNYPEIMALFSPDAQVSHPVLGQKPAAQFFTELEAQVKSDKITKSRFFYELKNPKSAIVYFSDEWTSVSGKTLTQDFILVFEFDENNLVKQLTVIFDNI